jgi:hypothetical protein
LKHARDVTATALKEPIFVGFSDELKGNVRRSVDVFILFLSSLKRAYRFDNVI